MGYKPNKHNNILFIQKKFSGKCKYIFTLICIFFLGLCYKLLPGDVKLFSESPLLSQIIHGNLRKMCLPED